MNKRQKQIIKQHAKDTAKHFKQDKWNLDASMLAEHLAYDLLGFHPSDELKRELVKYYKKPIYLKFDDKKLVLSLNKGKKKDFALALHAVYNKKSKDEVIVIKLKKKKKRAKRSKT